MFQSKIVFLALRISWLCFSLLIKLYRLLNFSLDWFKFIQGEGDDWIAGVWVQPNGTTRSSQCSTLIERRASSTSDVAQFICNKNEYYLMCLTAKGHGGPG